MGIDLHVSPGLFPRCEWADDETVQRRSPAILLLTQRDAQLLACPCRGAGGPATFWFPRGTVLPRRPKKSTRLVASMFRKPFCFSAVRAPPQPGGTLFPREDVLEQGSPPGRRTRARKPLPATVGRRQRHLAGTRGARIRAGRLRVYPAVDVKFLRAAAIACRAKPLLPRIQAGPYVFESRRRFVPVADAP